MKYILKLFPEIMVKGSAVKKKMVTQLNENLIRVLKRVDERIETKKFWDKIEIQSPDEVAEQVKGILLRTPGIEQVLEAVQYEVTTQEEIAQYVAEHFVPLIKDKTFVARCKRVGEHDFSSFELERFVGSYLYEQGEPAGVDLKHPQVRVRFELDNTLLNIILHRYEGLGGFPLGSQGDVLSLMSGGFDSTVASYLSIKRGLKTHYIFFNLGGAAHEIGVKQVALYLWARYSASHRVQFVTIPFEEVVAEIFRSTHESYMGVTLKRLMIQAAEQVADQMGIDALVTGESVAQVSSQTLRNLALIDEASHKLILRPLALMNKPDIMRMADKIGTRHYAENMPEYCGVISKNPITHGSFKRMAKESVKFNEAVLQQAVEQAKSIPVDTIVADVNDAQAIEVLHEVNQEIVIDIRSEAEVAQQPLGGIQNKLEIPFYDLNQKFKQLDQSADYLLYCEKGVMSQLHAQYLKDQGFENIKVYRPA